MPDHCFNVKKSSSLKALFWIGIFLSYSFFSSPANLCADDKKAGVTFGSRIRQWVSLTSLSEQSGVRDVCNSLSKAKNIPIILDRKLDPHRPVKLLPPVEGSIAEVLTRLAGSQNAELRQLGNALLILSTESAAKLRTLVALRTGELRSQITASGKTVRYDSNQIQRIMNRHSRQWDDLSQPRELVIEAAKKARLKIENPEIIPHDLWYRGELPRAHLIEFISFVLVQYDLTFSWKNAETIRIVKTPPRVVIEQTHQLSKNKLSKYRDQLLKKFPQSEWKQQGSRILVTGPLELQEQLKVLLENKPATKTSNRIPWKKRRYTMRVLRKPLGEVLDFLVSSGLPIQFDKQQIKSLGIDLEQLVSFETEDADAKQLMEALCEPVKLPFYMTADEIHIGKNKK